MNKEFIPYEQALALKELRFDGPCIYAWCSKGGWNKYEMIKEPITQILKTDGNPFGRFFNGKNWNKEITNNTKNSIKCSAPLYQQAFRWFREKYHIIGEPFYKGGLTKQTSWYDYKIYSTIDWIDNNPKQQWKTYEEAELECLKKLIEIVKKEQNESNIRI